MSPMRLFFSSMSFDNGEGERKRERKRERERERERKRERERELVRYVSMDISMQSKYILFNAPFHLLFKTAM